MSKAKGVKIEGCKNAFLIGLALAAGAVNSAAAERAAAVVIGDAVDRAASGLSNIGASNSGSISPDGSAQKTPFAATDMEPGLDRNVALGRARDVVRRMAADGRELFADAASVQRLSMEVEMKTGHQKSNKNPQLDSPVGAHPAVMFPKKSDEDLQMKTPKPAKVYRPPTPPKSEEKSR
jgi:hypothetical protein